MATLGLGATLVATPVTALADEVVSTGLTAENEAVTEEAVIPGERGDLSDFSTEEKPSDNPVSLDENNTDAALSEGQTGAVDSTNPAQGTDGAGDLAPEGDSGSPDTVVTPSPEDKIDAPIDQAGANETDGVTTLTPAPIADGVLAVTDALSPESAEAEVDLPKVGWDGNSYWDGTVNEDGTAKVYTGWVVDEHEGQGLQRYWIKDGKKVTNDVFEIGDGTFGYALSSWVLRGVSEVIDGLVYVANNDGVLLSAGWHVGDYGQGLQRYWIDDDKHAAIVGFADGSKDADLGNYAHYTTNDGYVLRGGKELAGKKYYANNDGRVTTNGWVVTGDLTGGMLQRYWATEDGSFLKNDFVPGIGYLAYADADGIILRGGDVINGKRYWANNDGRITTNGWVVTGDFTGGALQRYWADEDGAFYTKGAFDTGLGYWSYAYSDGTILRGKLAFDSGVYLADNDGRFATQLGWLVSGQYDGGSLQRYYIVSSSEGYTYARVGFFEARLNPSDRSESWFYSDTKTGYVLRGKTSTSSGILLSNNEGVLFESTQDGIRLKAQGGGFAVTSLYDGGLQRYYLKVVGNHLYVATGHIEASDGNHYYAMSDTGYVLRGKMKYGNGMLLADNDGVLAWKKGWLVTDKYDGAGNYQRYYIDDAPGGGLMGAHIGKFSVDGKDYYGREDHGYVVRGYYISPSGKVYYGDNDGVLTTIPLSQVAINLWNRIKNVSSATQYLIAVDCENCHTVVFQGSAGNWTPIFDWLCGVGLPQYNNGQGTIRGEWTIGGDNSYCNWTDDPDFSEWGDPYTWQTTYFAKDDIKWYTNFCLDLGFHSTIGWDGGYSDPNQIGKKISHGCIRLLEENAKWIYYNAGYGTKVVTVWPSFI